MPLYSCDLCKVYTDLKSNHIRHLKTKKHERNEQKTALMNTKEHKKNTKEHKKNTKEHKKNTVEKKYKCQYCDEIFNTFPSKRRHELHYCKHNTDEKSNNVAIKAIVNNHNKEKKKLYKQIEKLIDKSGIKTNNLTIQNTQNTQNTQNIKLNSYGQEDLSHITNMFKTNLLKGPHGMIPKMIEAVHFNDNKPENKNIKFTNKRDNKIKVFSENKWIHKNKDETINDLMDGKYFILDTHYSKLINNDDGTTNIMNFYEKFRKLFDEQDTNLLESQKKECELILLNNR